MNSSSSFEGSAVEKLQTNIEFVLPSANNIFYEFKNQKELKLCRPHLMPLKSMTLEKLAKMQRDAHQQLQETRARTAAASQIEP